MFSFLCTWQLQYTLKCLTPAALPLFRKEPGSFVPSKAAHCVSKWSGWKLCCLNCFPWEFRGLKPSPQKLRHHKRRNLGSQIKTIATLFSLWKKYNRIKRGRHFCFTLLLSGPSDLWPTEKDAFSLWKNLIHSKAMKCHCWENAGKIALDRFWMACVGQWSQVALSILQHHSSARDGEQESWHLRQPQIQ